MLLRRIFFFFSPRFFSFLTSSLLCMLGWLDSCRIIVFSWISCTDKSVLSSMSEDAVCKSFVLVSCRHHQFCSQIDAS